MSMDDFIISFFVTGATTTTLPLKVYSSVKTGVSASGQRAVHAHAVRCGRARCAEQIHHKEEPHMKRFLALCLALSLVLTLAPALGEEEKVLNIFSWEGYVDETTHRQFHRGNRHFRSIMPCLPAMRKCS